MSVNNNMMNKYMLDTSALNTASTTPQANVQPAVQTNAQPTAQSAPPVLQAQPEQDTFKKSNSLVTAGVIGAPVITGAAIGGEIGATEKLQKSEELKFKGKNAGQAISSHLDSIGEKIKTGEPLSEIENNIIKKLNIQIDSPYPYEGSIEKLLERYKNEHDNVDEIIDSYALAQNKVAYTSAVYEPVKNDYIKYLQNGDAEATDRLMRYGFSKDRLEILKKDGIVKYNEKYGEEAFSKLDMSNIESANKFVIRTDLANETMDMIPKHYNLKDSYEYSKGVKELAEGFTKEYETALNAAKEVTSSNIKANKKLKLGLAGIGAAIGLVVGLVINHKADKSGEEKKMGTSVVMKVIKGGKE